MIKTLSDIFRKIVIGYFFLVDSCFHQSFYNVFNVLLVSDDQDHSLLSIWF